MYKLEILLNEMEDCLLKNDFEKINKFKKEFLKTCEDLELNGFNVEVYKAKFKEIEVKTC